MKKIFLFIALILSLEQAVAQKHFYFELRAFDKIQINGNIDAQISRAGEEDATLSVNGIEPDRVSIEVEGRTLKIKIGFFEGRDALVKVWINYKEIREVNASNGASLHFTEPIKSNYMKISAGTGSSIDAQGEFRILEIKASAGSKINIRGKADIADISANTTAEVQAEGLVCQEGIFKAYTGAKITIQIEQSLEATSATGAEITVKGNPVIEKVSTSTGGILTRIKL